MAAILKDRHHLQQSPEVKKHLSLAIPGLLLGILTFVYLSYNEPIDFPDYKVTLILSGIGGVLVVYGIHLNSFLINRLISWTEHPDSRLLAGIVANFAAAFFIIWMLLLGYLAVDSGEYTQVPFQLMIRLAIIVFIGVLIYSIIYFAYHSYAYYQFIQVETVKQETRQIDLQLKALKTQLSPHFLFNSLNTISSLMYKDERAAENYIRNLAKSYQYTLPGYEKKWVTFSEECEYVKACFHLLATRFGDSLQLDIEKEEELLEIRLLPLALQMLVENAIKHNRIDKNRKLSIKVYSDKRWLIVSNNRTAKPESTESFKIGLKNINERYEILSGRSIRIIDEELLFTVKLPVV